MLCRCYRLILLCWLACCSQGATAVETLLEITEAPIADTGRYDRLREEISHA